MAQQRMTPAVQAASWLEAITKLRSFPPFDAAPEIEEAALKDLFRLAVSGPDGNTHRLIVPLIPRLQALLTCESSSARADERKQQYELSGFDPSEKDRLYVAVAHRVMEALYSRNCHEAQMQQLRTECVVAIVNEVIRSEDASRRLRCLVPEAGYLPNFAPRLWNEEYPRPNGPFLQFGEFLIEFANTAHPAPGGEELKCRIYDAAIAHIYGGDALKMFNRHHLESMFKTAQKEKNNRQGGKCWKRSSTNFRMYRLWLLHTWIDRMILLQRLRKCARSESFAKVTVDIHRLIAKFVYPETGVALRREFKFPPVVQPKLVRSDYHARHHEVISSDKSGAEASNNDDAQ